MSDALPSVFREHLVAGPDDIFARPDLDLLRPACSRQKLRNAQAPGCEGRDRLVKRRGFRPAHDVQRDLARGYLEGLAVLQPEHHFFVLGGRGQPRIELRGPRIGVMRAGKHVFPIAIGVERVFHHIVARDAGGVDEKLAGELR